MRLLDIAFVALLTGAFFSATLPGFAQQTDKGTNHLSAVDTRPSAALYDDAKSYAGKKYDEFNRTQLPYDPKLAEKIIREQRELAGCNAAILEGRGRLTGDDLYYLGLLYSLSGSNE